MDVVLKVYESDDSSLRETYTEVIGTDTNTTMEIRGLRFTITASGCAECSFEIHKAKAGVGVIKGDIIRIYDDSAVLRYRGIVEGVVLSEADNEQPIYEDVTTVTVLGTLFHADRIEYTLKGTDGVDVPTDVQTVVDDIFSGGEYVDKGQDHNIDLDSVNGIAYDTADNVLPSININITYVNTRSTDVLKDIYRIINGGRDLTSLEPYKYTLDASGDFITYIRDTGLLATYDIDDGDFALLGSVDLDPNGWRKEVDNTIYNKFVLNGTEIDTVNYATEVAASRSAHDIRKASELENKNISIQEAQDWLDGFILNQLEPTTVHTLTLKKEVYAIAPVWFWGGTEDGDGYIKLTRGGGGGSTEFTEPFISATYSLDASGWNIEIKAGTLKSSVDDRSRTLTELSKLGSFQPPSMNLSDPNDAADTTTLQGMEFLDDGHFETVWDNPEFPLTAADVKFKIKRMGRYPFTTGVVVKTLTSGTTPTVIASQDVGQGFVCFWMVGGTTKVVNGVTVHTLGLTVNTQYEVYAEYTLNDRGVARVVKSESMPFYLTTQTTPDKATDSYGRVPDAETDLKKQYTPVVTLKESGIHFFTAIGGDTPPDAGAAGWFITDDNIGGSWTRMTGDFAGNLAGTTLLDFEINAGGAAGQYMTLTMTSDTGGKVGILRYDKTNSKMEVSVNDGGAWVDVATGVSDSISAIYSAEVYELKVNSTDGSLTFTKDTGGTPDVLFKIDFNTMTVDCDIVPEDNDFYDLGAIAKRFNDIFAGGTVYTQDIVFTPNGGATVNGKIEVTSSVPFTEGFAIGFQDD